MREVGEFTAADDSLERRLQEFQTNVRTAIDELSGRAASRPALSTQTAGKVATPVRPGETRFVYGGDTVLLATPRPGDEGETLNLIQRTPGTVTVRSVGAQVNGAASIGLFFVGRYEFLIANGAYWGAP